MGNDKRSFSPPAIGGTSLLVVFAVLCLTVFALLSLATVRADVRLADASAQSVEGYYAADCKAQEILARLRNGERPEGVRDAGDGAVSYRVPISDTQELRVEVALHREEPDGPWEYTILRWQAAPVGEWNGDQSLNLWDGT